MSNKLFDFRELLDIDLYSPRETYVIFVRMLGDWMGADELGVKHKFTNRSDAEKQLCRIKEVVTIEDALLAYKLTTAYSDLETRNTIQVTEWTALLV